MTPPERILELVERFERNADAYRSGRYNETQVRREFIDPFFKCLGWDVANEQGWAEAYKDVIHEDAIRMGAATKAPDYCFRMGGARKFFVEAKKPSVDIKHDVHPAYQLRRYAWSAKLPLSVLTDFEEFAVYDCRVKPAKNDKAAKARILYIPYADYTDRWDDIASIFARDAILKGSFDRYAESTRRKRGTAEVDDSFLKEIEAWRDSLARNIALRNPDLSQRELNFAVQRTIDRIIFLRICEARGIEPYARLQSITNGKGVYERLADLFHRADERYNSGIFHFRREKGRAESPDELTLRLTIDDAPLKDIIARLYYPESPYEFSVLPPDILGQVYEQFLGKVIRLTKGHRAVVEEKPEVRKAGGVYYTPTYIVDYIVEHTVGKLLENRTPRTASDLKILDPACGSGSFLLGAYQRLLDWHLDQYCREMEKTGKIPTVMPQPGKRKRKSDPAALYQGPRGDWRLTTAERKRILLANIFGVDIDPQAVEVTKLSLLLKVLESESGETLATQLEFFHERALPDLSSNIKCGNSLIGPDFYDNQQGTLFEEEERFRINAFDWNAEFPAMMRRGGFDAVIGNPPYLHSAAQAHDDYFKSRYRLTQYQTDFYVFFVERALWLCRRAGLLSFIVSDSWLNSTYFSIMRGHLLSNHKILSVAVFDYPVFKGVTLENSIMVLSVASTPSGFPVRLFVAPGEYSDINRLNPTDCVNSGIIDPRMSESSTTLLTKLESGSAPLQALVEINRGLHAYRTDGYGKSKFGPGVQTKRDKEVQSYHSDEPLDDTYLPEIRGKHVHRFSISTPQRYLSYGPWLAEPRAPHFFFKPKAVLRKVLGTKLHGTFLERPYGIDQSLYILVSKEDDTHAIKFALGILVSALGAWYLRTKHSIYDRLYPWYTKTQLASFPIREGEEERSRRLVELVDFMLALNEQLPAAKTPHEKSSLERQIATTDRQIDQLVYELYGLTEDEIRIVEEAK